MLTFKFLAGLAQMIHQVLLSLLQGPSDLLYLLIMLGFFSLLEIRQGEEVHLKLLVFTV